MKRKKKIITMLLAAGMILSMSTCGTTCGTTSDTYTYSLGDSIETDILRITLTNAELAIKLNSTSLVTYEDLKSGNRLIMGDYFTADEYDASEDTGTAYVAAKGHTFVVFEYNAENLDRASVEVDDGVDRFMKIKYNDKTYRNDTKYGASSENGFEWEQYKYSNVRLDAGENEYLRGYIDIETDADNLNDEFDLIFTLPNSDGTTTDFTYHVTADDRDAEAEAIYSFLKEEGQIYFTSHLDDFETISADEIKQNIIGGNWYVNINIKEDVASWSGKYEFEDGGKIKETIYDGSVGYFNELTWKLDGDNLVISGKSDESCEVRKVRDGVYLLVLEGNPYALLQK